MTSTVCLFVYTVDVVNDVYAMQSDFGAAIKARRSQLRYTQEYVANKAEISRNYLSQIERGASSNISAAVQERICHALNLFIDSTGEIQINALIVTTERINLCLESFQKSEKWLSKCVQQAAPEDSAIAANHFFSVLHAIQLLKTIAKSRPEKPVEIWSSEE